MKKLVLIFGLLIGCLIVGCGDKGTDPPPGGDGDVTFVPRLVADTLSSAPSTVDANDAVWDAIDPTLVQIGFSEDYGQNPQMIKDTLMMKVILKSDMIYIWAQWNDPTPDIWGNYIRKQTGTGLWDHIFLADYNGEDAFMINFDAGNNGTEGADCKTMCHLEGSKMRTTGGGTSDAWCWKSSRIAPAYLAEDNIWNSDGNFLDPPAAINAQQPYRENWNSMFLRPKWMHPDDTAFAGPYLYSSDAVDFDPSPFIGWDSVSGYKMPGFVIDTTIYSRDIRDDRWNVLAASDYDSSSSPRTWTVVLSRTLFPASSNDVDLRTLDSIQVSVAASNEHTYGEDPSYKDHSGSVPFYIILPRP